MSAILVPALFLYFLRRSGGQPTFVERVIGAVKLVDLINMVCVLSAVTTSRL